MGVEAAARRIAGHVIETPLLPFSIGNQQLWAKCESLQTGGAFKLRGATNRLALLTEAERERGVVAFSSGNHAQGVAIAAKRLGIAATIVMPSDAPAVKREATESAGATIIAYDRLRESREEIASAIAAESGAVVVPSFDDVDIIEGQGSVGIEIARQLGTPPDKVIVPCGGGGLSAGIALALPEAEIVAVEPEGWDDMARSLEAGMPVALGPNPPQTRCDAIQTLITSPLTVDALIDHGARAVTVSEDDIAEAMRFAMRTLRLVVEPGGAAALAAALAGKAGPLSARSVVVLSGGNVDPRLYAKIMTG